jgi:hypothetical protein
MIYYAIVMCLYFHTPEMQDRCEAVYQNILFPRDVCEAALSHGGLHDSVRPGTRGPIRTHFLCGETLGVPGKSWICHSWPPTQPGTLPCKRYTVPAEFPEDQEPTEIEPGPGQ